MEYRVKNKGFTLVELLVVIAILGVLAAVLIVALNPAEQIAKGRDIGRLQDVQQLGQALQNYATNVNNAVYPVPNGTTTWQTTYLIGNGEINHVITVPATAVVCSTNVEGNICYQSDGTSAVVWTIDESKTASVKAGGGTACPANQVAAAVWDSTQGKTGLACISNVVSTVPAYGITLN